MALIPALMRRLHPLRGIVSWREYRRLAAYPRFREGTARVLGRELRFSDSLGLLHSLQEIFVEEVYCFDAPHPVPRILDAGANIGLSVLYFKRRFPAAHIIAWEPDPAIFALLAANVGTLDGVELRNAAAWTEDGELSFWSEGSLAGSSEVDFAGTGRKVTVKAERLRDTVLAAPVDFLKIDIEGAENHVLPDLVGTLGQVRHLFFEYHSTAGQPQRLDELLAIARAAGFRVAISGTHGPGHPYVETVTSGFDLQLNALCYRPRTEN